MTPSTRRRIIQGFHASTTGALVYGVTAGRSAAPAVVAMLVIAVAAISNDTVVRILFIAKRPVFRFVRGERSHPIKSERPSPRRSHVDLNQKQTTAQRHAARPLPLGDTILRNINRRCYGRFGLFSM